MIHLVWKMIFLFNKMRRKQTHTHARVSCIVDYALAEGRDKKEGDQSLEWITVNMNCFMIETSFPYFLTNKYFDACCLLFNQTLVIMKRMQVDAIASPNELLPKQQQQQTTATNNSENVKYSGSNDGYIDNRLKKEKCRIFFE